MAYYYRSNRNTQSGKRAGKCVSLITGETVTRADAPKIVLKPRGRERKPIVGGGKVSK